MTSYTITEYQKVQKPHRLEYLDYFATPQGEKDTSMPGMQILMDFKESNGKTTVILHLFSQHKMLLNKL